MIEQPLGYKMLVICQVSFDFVKLVASTYAEQKGAIPIQMNTKPAAGFSKLSNHLAAAALLHVPYLLLTPRALLDILTSIYGSQIVYHYDFLCLS